MYICLLIYERIKIARSKSLNLYESQMINLYFTELYFHMLIKFDDAIIVDCVLHNVIF